MFESFYLEYQKQWDNQREMTNMICIYNRGKNAICYGVSNSHPASMYNFLVKGFEKTKDSVIWHQCPEQQVHRPDWLLRALAFLKYQLKTLK